MTFVSEKALLSIGRVPDLETIGEIETRNGKRSNQS